MIERDRIDYGGTSIAYSIFYSRKRKTACITVYPSGEVKISVPYRAGRPQIRRFMAEKAPWVLKKLDAFKRAGCRDAARKYAEGEVFLFKGREYALNVIEGDGPIATLGATSLNAIVPPGLSGESRAQAIKSAIFDWYRLQAEMAVAEAMPRYCDVLQVPVPPFRVKNQSRRWGSCTGKNFLNFNLKIAMAPPEQLEYVVLHELCHIRHKDHSPKYWALVGSIMPDYKERKKALREDGWKYEL